MAGRKSSQIVYLDHAGAALPTPELLQSIANSLTAGESELLANPHSGHAMGQRARALVQKARNRILDHFGTNSSEFDVIFTANATAGLKLLAETFNTLEGDEQPTYSREKEFSTDLNCLMDSSKSTLLMLNDSHTSVLGMRQAGTFQRIVVADFDELKQFLQTILLKRSQNANENGHPNAKKQHSLFVMTAMSNFCGRIYDLEMADLLKRALGPHWKVCFDTAALAPHSMDIGLAHCDFAVLSFYKMFGYPTGLGALLVRRECADLMRKGYFGGGTVGYASISSPEVHFRGDIAERFEDGTANIYAIRALLLAFDELEGRKKLSNPMKPAQLAHSTLTSLKHPNGTPLAVVYGKGWAEDEDKNGSKMMTQGPIVNFNLLREDGSPVGFVEVDRMADLFGIQLRTGCHCNLGACAKHLGLDEADLQRNFQLGKVCGDDVDLVDGKALGTVRISFGRTSTEKDVQIFRQMLECCFLSTSGSGPSAQPQAQIDVPSIGRLTHLYIYPVKSCGGIQKQSWPICPKSATFLHDRRWMVLRKGTGELLTQKRYPTLCSVQPEVEMDSNELILKDREGFVLSLHLPFLSAQNSKENGKENGMNCLDSSGLENLLEFGGETASEWLAQMDPSLASCTLVMAEDVQQRRSFSNQADFLLITRSSAQFLAEQLQMPVEDVIQRFRPNLVVDFGPGWRPFQEEQVERLAIGSLTFKVVGLCQRCQMICIDQINGEKNPNVLIALRNMRLEQKRSLVFGLYLELERTEEGGDGWREISRAGDDHSGFAGRRELHAGSTVHLLLKK